MTPSSPAPFTVVDFVAEFALDLQAGKRLPLGHYLRRHPGHAEAIAREYLAMLDGPRENDAMTERIGRYELRHELGRGGQGRVHLARDPDLARYVAIKVLDRHQGIDQTRVERFRREVDASMRLDHPHVARLFAADVDHDPPYAVMELVPGRSLADWIATGSPATAATGGRVLPASAADRRRCLLWFEQVARAVHAVHTAGLVHRDLKPANLMLTPDGEPRILDFGLAVPAERTTALTLTGTQLGTLPYMAPEQLQSGAVVDRRADVFALGVTMCEAWTGDQPFAGKTPTARIESIEAGLPWRTQRCLPPDLRAILTKATALAAAHRYLSAADLADDLKRLRENRVVLARPTGHLHALQRWAKRHPLVCTWFLAMLSALLVAVQARHVAQEAAAAANAQERSVRAALSATDPWRTDRAFGSGLETLLDAVVPTADTRMKLALLQLRVRGPAAALAFHATADDPDSERNAALAWTLRSLVEEVNATTPAFGAVAPVVDAVLGELYRLNRWEDFDRLLAAALTLTADAAPSADKARKPLRLWQLQGAACRGNTVAMAGVYVEEMSFLLRRHERWSPTVLEAELALLTTTAVVAPELGALQAARRCAAQLLRDWVRSGREDDELSLRLESLALGIAADEDDTTFARLETVRQRQAERLGEEHRHVVETTWLLGRRLASQRPLAARSWLARAWGMAAGWSDPAERPLQAMILADHARAAEADDLRLLAVRWHFETFGAADPRTVRALFDPPLAVAASADVDGWMQRSRAALTDLPGRDRDRLQALRGIMWATGGAGRVTYAETLAVESARRSQPLVATLATDGTNTLVGFWLRAHDHLRGEALLHSFAAAVADWRTRAGLGADGTDFAAAAHVSLTGRLLAADRLAEADRAMAIAVTAATEWIGLPTRRTWAEGAMTLPAPDDRTARVLGCAATLAERLGRDDLHVALRRMMCRQPDPWQRLLGEHTVRIPHLLALARAERDAGHFDACERTLARLLAVPPRHGEDVDSQQEARLLLDRLVAVMQASPEREGGR